MAVEFNLSDFLILFGFLLIFIIIPGFSLQIILRTGSTFFNKIGLSFAFGFACFSLLSLLAYLMSMPFHWMLNLALGVSLLLFLFAIFKLVKEKNRGIHGLNFGLQEGVVLIIAVLSFMVSLYSGWMPRGDAAIHLQVIRNMMAETQISHAFYSLPGNPIIPDHAYDSYYVFFALIGRNSTIELSWIWHYLSPWLAFLIPFTIYSFVKQLTDKKSLQLISVLAFFFIVLIYPKIMYGSVLDAVVYPNRVYLWLILPSAFTVFFKFLYERKPLFLWINAALVISLILIHQSGFLFFNITLGMLWLLFLLYKGELPFRKGRLITGLLLIDLLALPVLILKLIPNMSYIAGSSSVVWHQHYSFFYLTDSLFAFSFKTYYVSGMLVAALIVLYGLYRQKKSPEKSLFVLFMSAGFLAAMLIVFNPFIVPFLGKAISYVAIIRMLRIPMYFLILAWLIHEFGLSLGKIMQKKSVFLLKRILLFGTLTLFVMVSAIKINKGTVKHELLPVATVLPYIEDDQGVFTDQLTATDIAVFKQINTPVIQFNGAADLVDIDYEKELVNDVLNDSISIIRVYDILYKAGTDLVVINKEISSPKFDFDQSEFFEKLYLDSVFTVYKFNPVNIEE
ncbi:MAG: hypothetical protein C0592_07245 [Marinilabiliales bacterium]|nr:MAG: hypothetical protein C0592_07245 [Marinilabiliales bacterium]